MTSYEDRWPHLIPYYSVQLLTVWFNPNHDRELERVYQIVVHGLDKLKKLKEDFESQCANNTTTDRDKKQSKNSLKSVNDVITVVEGRS